ncbi:NAD(P)-dependent oxidoreductase [Amycolatopsis jiangsuensis]|uniref:3-hydroxyisobutyrate dehydrogenase-like beta-hydroxyacid dehydrogenase n=1 Tax=Amycolatopsis jiangsuensis TaxID=1181879 RepID=A0A840IV65_9PSEU|nr:NAD(P)-binding domain-containing protein [Amycolatopsis jiangsuensis]MBB4685663.1 3-hydroxyisobutyrate dehydrogenase-like beta-hydroxyacid dehydrogenase [Amycolatopsis jiangsuensis]
MTVTIAVLGLGEAGGALARDLVAAGAAVRAYDPAIPSADGVVTTGSEAEAAESADLVLSVNSASAGVGALEAGLAGLREGAVWVDLNTASPGTKRRLAGIAAEHGVPFADVAIMAPVPGRGLRVPMLATGVAAEAVAAMLNPLGAAVEVMDGEAGLAAERKLLRSVFFKGMSAAVVEALRAARAAGCEDWLRDIIVGELTAAGESTVDRLVDGSRRHAVRRTSEMAAAAEMLTELGVRADVASASRAQLADLAGRTDGVGGVDRVGGGRA